MILKDPGCFDAKMGIVFSELHIPIASTLSNCSHSLFSLYYILKYFKYLGESFFLVIRCSINKYIPMHYVSFIYLNIIIFSCDLVFNGGFTKIMDSEIRGFCL